MASGSMPRAFWKGMRKARVGLARPLPLASPFRVTSRGSQTQDDPLLRSSVQRSRSIRIAASVASSKDNDCTEYVRDATYEKS